MKLISRLSFDVFISIGFVVAVLQALLGNLTSFDTFYFLPAYLFVVFLLSLKSQYKNMNIEGIFVFFFLLIFMFISLYSPKYFKHEFYLQVFFFLSFVMMYYISGVVYLSSLNNIKAFTMFFLIFFLVSLLIHLFFWQSVAELFYQRENEFGGLMMDGVIPRMYSLLLNPLTLAFSCLFILALFFSLDIKGWGVKFLLSASIVLSFSRTAMLCLVILWLIYALSKRYYIFLFSLCCAFLFFLLFNEVVQEVVVATITGNDNTGSSSEHYRNIQIGLKHVFDFQSVNGFVDARDFGGWNYRLESTPFQFALTGGFFSFFLFVIIYITSLVRVFYHRGFFSGCFILAVLPVIIFFPVHSFGFGVFTLMILLLSWRIRVEKPMVHNYEK